MVFLATHCSNLFNCYQFNRGDSYHWVFDVFAKNKGGEEMLHRVLKPWGHALVALAAMTTVACSETAANGECALIPEDSVGIEASQRADALRAFKFAQVEDELAKLHKKNMSSDGGDLLTLRDLVDLEKLSGSSVNLARMWQDQRPQSFFANMYAGMIYESSAQANRGTGPASSVRPEQWQVIKKNTELANEHLQKAMALEPKSALPHSIFITLAGKSGPVGGRSVQQWQEAADQADPKNMAARIQSMNYLSPRWGGSFEVLDKMVADAGKALSRPTEHYLQYNLVLAKASHEEVIEKDKAKAQVLYKQAQTMCTNSQSARAGVLRTY